jgi:hypothetical protein
MDMKWWWDGLTLAQGAEAHCWLKKKWQATLVSTELSWQSVGPKTNMAQVQAE